jgi:hypothetical protein
MHFREATMDFECLWKLNYDDVLQCSCDHPYETLIGDGITVSCRQSNLRLCGPWLPKQPVPGEDAVEQLLGSKYESRFAVPVPKLRHLLRSLSSANGMDAVMYEEVLEECARNDLQTFADALNALRVLVAPNPVLPEWVRELGANSPACAIVCPCALGLLQDWLAVVAQVLLGENEAVRMLAAQAWTQDHVDRAQQAVPVLVPALRHLLLAAVVQTLPNNHVDALACQIRALCEVCDASICQAITFELFGLVTLMHFQLQTQLMDMLTFLTYLMHEHLC